MILKCRLKRYIIITCVIVILYLFIESIFSLSMTNLPKGKQIRSLKSPNGDNIMNIYIIDGGSISADAIRVEIKFNKDFSTKNIYYSYPENNPDVEAKWINNENVLINGIKLNIYKDKYEKKG